MEWESKVELVRLGNQRHNSVESKEKFYNFVLEKINTFDTQAWDMFCNLVDLIADEIKGNPDFWTQVYNKIKDIDCNEGFGFRSAARISIIQTMCKDLLQP